MKDLEDGQELISVWASDQSGARVGYQKCTNIKVGRIAGHMTMLNTAIAEFEDGPERVFVLSNCQEFTVRPTDLEAIEE